MLRDGQDKRRPFVVDRFRGADRQQVTANQYAHVVDVLRLEVIELYAVQIAC